MLWERGDHGPPFWTGGILTKCERNAREIERGWWQFARVEFDVDVGINGEDGSTGGEGKTAKRCA